ncbi:MAG TPA: DUF695 domain-containing protein [Lysobacter sp.]|nr:DUF695 domain-containing protein [Lysobacter sp.]
MSEQWDFYLCQVDGKPASIYLDLGIVSEAPIQGYGHVARIDLSMLAPRSDGLSSQVEFDRLNAIEDALCDQLIDHTHYVGRVTSDDQREFYFYLAAAEDWQDKVAAAMALFPEYTYQTDVREDPQWQAYLEFLYPDDAARHSISNRHVCDALERNGDALDQPRVIDHWAYFPDEKARSMFITRVAALGYELREVWGPNEDIDAHAVRVYRSDVPSYDNIDDVTHALLYVAAELGGEYDGWECAVVKETEAASRSE